MKTICVFCGSSPGLHPDYMNAAQALGAVLAKKNLRLVYGGSSLGLMGAVADSVLNNGGEVTGVIPEFLKTKEIVHHGLSDLRTVKSMHDRKLMMADLSDGFIALPGGFGTFEEFCEILTGSQLSLQKKPTGLLDVRNYYQPLVQMFDSAVTEKFVRPEHRELVLYSDNAADLITKFENYKFN